MSENNNNGKSVLPPVAIPGVVDSEECNMERIRDAAAEMVSASHWVLKGDGQGREVAFVDAYTHNNAVLRSSLSMTLRAEWLQTNVDTLVHVDIAPFATSRFLAIGPQRYTRNPGVRDVAATALLKTVQNLSLAPDLAFRPEVAGLDNVDWWGMYPVVGFLMANIARYVIGPGRSFNDPLDSFLRVFEATNSPQEVGDDGVPIPRGDVLGEFNPAINLHGITMRAHADYCGLTARLADRRSPPRLDAEAPTLWVPEGFNGGASCHTLCFCMMLYNMLCPSSKPPEVVGHVVMGGVPDLTVGMFTLELERVLGMLDTLHGSEDIALARMLYVQGLGGAVRVHSAYSEGGVLRKAARLAAVGALRGVVWQFPGTVISMPDQVGLLYSDPMGFIASAGWLQLQHVLVLQQALCQAGPLLVRIGVPADERPQLRDCYRDLGYEVEFSSLPEGRQELDVSAPILSRLSRPDSARQLRVGLRVLYGGQESSYCYESLMLSVKMSHCHAHMVVLGDDMRIHTGEAAEGDVLSSAYIDRFADPELAVACGLPTNHAAVLHGWHEATVEEVSRRLLAGGDIRDDAVCTALAVAGYASEGCNELRLCPADGERSVLVEMTDGRVERVGRRGRPLSQLMWNHHGRLPAYHSLSFFPCAGGKIQGLDTFDGKIRVGWLRSGKVAEILAVINPRVASAVAVESL